MTTTIFNRGVAEITLRVVAEAYGLSADYVRERGRRPAQVEARFVAMALTQGHDEEVGAFFDRDRSTTSYARQAFGVWVKTYPEFKARVEQLKIQIAAETSKFLAKEKAA